MHFRRIACLLLGAWLGGSFFMTMVAVQNFRSVDRLLEHPAPAAAQQLSKLDPDNARALLRYQVAEQNRWYFETWEVVQLALGGLLFFLLLFGSTESKYVLLLSLLMLGLVAVARFVLTPEIVSLGRLIDFVPRSAPSAERNRFWAMHTAYSTVEVVKWVLGFVLAGKLLVRRRRRSGDAAHEFNLVDKADHGHIDR